MLVVMPSDATEADVKHVVQRLREVGAEAVIGGHPDPATAPAEGARALPLAQLEEVVRLATGVHRAVRARG